MPRALTVQICRDRPLFLIGVEEGTQTGWLGVRVLVVEGTLGHPECKRVVPYFVEGVRVLTRISRRAYYTTPSIRQNSPHVLPYRREGARHRQVGELSLPSEDLPPEVGGSVRVPALSGVAQTI